LVHILAVLAELDLLKSSISFFEDIKKVKVVSPFRWVIHTKIKMPITISNRDVVLVGFGVTDKKNKSILVPLKSVDNYIDTDVPEETSKYKRITMNFGFFQIENVEEGTYRITCCYNINPRVSIIPWFILNTFVKETGWYIMDGLRKVVGNDKQKEEREKRIKDNSEFYDMVNSVMIDFD
jgi:hypothetical protein